MYCTADDPNERHELSEDHPELTQLLLEKFEAYADEEVYPVLPQAVQAEYRIRDGCHGPGWCSLQQLEAVRQQSVSGARSRGNNTGLHHSHCKMWCNCLLHFLQFNIC